MSKIALGTWAWGAGAFGGDAVFGSKTDVENLKPVFDAAMKAGLNLWDTATVYGMGESEKILGTFIAGEKRDCVEVSTKFTPQLAEVYANSVEKMADASIERMGCDYIDIYWIHNPMDVERWTPGLIPLLQSGKVKRVGVSNHNIKEIKRANEILGKAGFKVSAVQNHFSLLYRSSEKGGVLDYCKEQGIEFWAYMVLEQGALSGKYNKENPLPAESDRGKKYNPVLPQLEALTNEMTAIGQKYDASCSQIGIAWAIAKGTLPIIGATKERHVIEAAEATRIQLTAEEMAKLEALADATGIDTRGGWEHSME
ncbi:Predicted oxidoreductase [Segatella bryantii]|uniref:aldo/keto reductase n=1 Tax=Segatella bryantii TaxID=77095 RepID=UPI0008961DFF|nr:aldo/keto reductase [Segatella bryantii]SDZ77545.1 Predicted oxidoreductase [Segatella bryantii]